MTPQPQDPFTGLSDAATQLHEFFVSLVSKGFTEAQALRLIGEMLASSGRTS